jgi:hypothetical protein
MNVYTYSWKELETARKEMESRQPFEIRVSGWRAGPAYSLFKHFAAVEKGTGRFGSALIASSFGFLLPGLSLIASQSRLSGYGITVERHEKETLITLRPAE